MAAEALQRQTGKLVREIMDEVEWARRERATRTLGDLERLRRRVAAVRAQKELMDERAELYRERAGK
jgi:polyhydroxyalkanoate synthesis regulator phasin